MNEQIKQDWVAALNDPKYAGELAEIDWQFLHRVSKNGPPRHNVFGVLDDVLNANQDTASFMRDNVFRASESVHLAPKEPGRGWTILRVQVLSVPPSVDTYRNRLPPEAEALAGLEKVAPEKLAELIELNKAMVPFSELASYIQANF